MTGRHVSGGGWWEMDVNGGIAVGKSHDTRLEGKTGQRPPPLPSNATAFQPCPSNVLFFFFYFRKKKTRVIILK